MTTTQIVQIITGFVGSFSFAILFNIRGKRLAFAALGGFLSWSMFIVLGFFFDSEPLRYFIVSTLISIYAEILARVLKTPTTTFITTSMIPLIPGGSLYYTMAHAFEGDLTSFLESALYTIQLAGALALGVVVATGVARFMHKFLAAKKV